MGRLRPPRPQDTRWRGRRVAQGPGQGSEQAIMALKNKDIEVTQILNVTGVPHNGCRPPKRRRV
mgnify:CR=1 FL=1